MSNVTTKQLTTIVNKRIKDGSLPKSLKVPSDLKVPKDIPKGYEAVFVPRGLTLNQWNILLGKTCNGLYSYDYNRELSQGSGWEVHVVYAGSKPLELSEGFDSSKPNLTIETYLALQWQRLEAGKKPVDKLYWSWCSQKDNFGLQIYGAAPYVTWNPGIGQVNVVWGKVGLRSGHLGVRPEVRDSTLDSRPDSAILGLPKELVINNERYRKV